MLPVPSPFVVIEVASHYSTTTAFFGDVAADKPRRQSTQYIQLLDTIFKEGVVFKNCS